DRARETDAPCNHTAFDFVVPSDLRCDASPVVQLLFASLTLCFGEGNIGEPWFTPVDFFVSLARVDNLPHGVQIRAARLAEFQFITLIRTTSWTKHVITPTPAT